MESRVIEKLVDQLGSPALTYLLGIEADDRANALPGTAEDLTDSQEQGVALLNAISLTRINSTNTPPQLLWPWILVQRSGVEEKALSAVIREASGKSVLEPHPDTPVLERLLMRMAVDSYASLLIHDHFASEEPVGPSMSLREHPLHGAFMSAASSDSALEPLIAVGRGDRREEALLYRSTGHGMTFLPSHLADQLVNAAWTLAQLTSPTPSPHELAVAATRSLGRLRKALRGEVLVPTRIGLAGVLLPEDMSSVDFGWAKLRLADRRDSSLARMTGLVGGTSTNDDGTTTAIRFAGDLVLQFDSRYAMRIRHQRFDEPWMPALQRTSEDIETVAETIRLGLLLSTGDPLRSIYPSWRTVVEPLSFGLSVGWTDPSLAAGVLATRLTTAQVSRWREWVRLVHDNREHIGVGIRRMLLAINDRKHPEDVLLDAVVVWENVFGVQPDTTEGVTDALAQLLNPPGPSRASAKNAYRRIYRVRSDIIHGARKVDNWTLQHIATEAVSVSLATLQELFANRQDLLRISSSTRRNAAVRR